MRRINANTVRFGAVNYYAYYPTDLIRRHPQFGGRDLVRETVEATLAPYRARAAELGRSHTPEERATRMRWRCGPANPHACRDTTRSAMLRGCLSSPWAFSQWYVRPAGGTAIW